MMKSVDEHAQSLQGNKQPASKNVARLSQLYDEVTN